MKSLLPWQAIKSPRKIIVGAVSQTGRIKIETIYQEYGYEK